MSEPDQKTPDRIVSTEITWNGGCNPTVEKRKKKKKGKKVNVEVKVDSFFNIFRTLEPSKDDKPASTQENDEDADEAADDIETQMAFTAEMGDQMKDDLVHLALEYYLGAIEYDGSDAGGSNDGDGEKEDAEAA